MKERHVARAKDPRPSTRPHPSHSPSPLSPPSLAAAAALVEHLPPAARLVAGAERTGERDVARRSRVPPRARPPASPPPGCRTRRAAPVLARRGRGVRHAARRDTPPNPVDAVDCVGTGADVECYVDDRPGAEVGPSAARRRRRPPRRTRSTASARARTSSASSTASRGSPRRRRMASRPRRRRSWGGSGGSGRRWCRPSSSGARPWWR